MSAREIPWLVGGGEEGGSGTGKEIRQTAVTTTTMTAVV